MGSQGCGRRGESARRAACAALLAALLVPSALGEGAQTRPAFGDEPQTRPALGEGPQTRPALGEGAPARPAPADGCAAPSPPVSAASLLALARDRGPEAETRLLEGLADATPDAVGRLLAFARGESAPSASAPKPASAPADDAWRQNALALLQKLPAAALRECQRSGLEPARAAAYRRIGLDALAFLGNRFEHVRAALALAARAASPGGLEPEAAAAFEFAVAEILRRDPASVAEMAPLFETSDPLCRVHLAAGLGGTGRVEASRVLVRFLGKWRPLDRYLLQHVGRRPGPVPMTLPEADLQAVRAQLDSRDDETRREALLAVGRLDDVEAVPFLVERLKDAHRGVRESAHWALCRITGLGFRPDPDRWQGWLALERAWWANHGAELLARLDSTREPDVARAVRELAQRRLARRQVTPQLLALCSEGDPRSSRLAFAAVESLRDPGAVPGLVALLDSSDERVRTEAHRALGTLTGEQRAAASAAWRDLLP